MTRRKGFVSPARAASMLGIHRNTTYGWAMDAIRGEASKFRAVERNPVTGRLAIPVNEVMQVKSNSNESE